MLRHHLDDATHTLSGTLQYTYLLRRLEPKQHLHLHDLYMKFCEFREKIRNRCSRTKRNASTQYAHCRSVFIGAREGGNRAEVECEIIEAPKILEVMLRITAVFAALVMQVLAVDRRYNYVTCGSALKIAHTACGARLHSHEIKYPSGETLFFSSPSSLPGLISHLPLPDAAFESLCTSYHV